MNLFNSQNQKHTSSSSTLFKHNNKKRLSQDQVRLLELSFSSNKKLEPDRKLQLARELGIPPRQIAIWYQNRRARWKSQSMELDYGALQLRLDSVAADKRRLEREVHRLRMELDAAHKLFACLSHNQQHQEQQQQQEQPPPHHVSSLSSYCDERESSSSLQLDGGGGGCGGGSGGGMSYEALHLDELYACLIGTDGSNCSGNRQ